MGRDPREETGGRNLYGFVTNNPINRWDYLGMNDGFLACGYAQGLADWMSAPMVNTINPSAIVFAQRKLDEASRALKIQQNVANNQALLTPAARDAMALSSHAYDRGTLPAHLVQQSVGVIITLGLDPKCFHDDRSGFSASLYLNTNTGQYVLAFRGGELERADWTNNAAQMFGFFSAQYCNAMNLAFDVDRSVSAIGATFISTCHSLGGGLARAAAIVTGTPAIAFNSAEPNSIMVFQRNGSDLSNAANLITAYYVTGEVLRAVQDLTPFPNAAGTRIALAPRSSSGPISLHNMDQVFLAAGSIPFAGPVPPEPMGPFAPGP